MSKCDTLVCEPKLIQQCSHPSSYIFSFKSHIKRKIHNQHDKYSQLFFLMNKRISDFDPTPSRIFGQRVLELKEQGVNEQDAIDVADTEYRLQKKSKKKAYKRLKEIAKLRGTKPPPNPYPSAVKEIQAEEKKYVQERFFNPRILDIVDKLKEQQAAEMQDRGKPGGGF